MPCSSDAETVLGDGDEENSPLSPCFWTHTADHEAEQSTEEAAAASRALQTSLRRDGALRPARREMRLSPASQLNVLSQISELADVQSRQSTAAAAAAGSKPFRQAQRAHVWAPTGTAAKRKAESTAHAPAKPKVKKQKKSKRKPARSLAERLAADMADWETCSEGDLFAVEGDANELDEWVYEDISDGDFEA